VAGVVSKAPVGIDIEKIKPISDSLFNRIVDVEELKCFDDESKQVIFFRSFTAKEAVLKKTSGLNHHYLVLHLDSLCVVFVFFRARSIG